MISSTPNFSPWRVVSLITPLASILVAILMMPLPIGIKVWGHTIMPSLPLLAIFLWTVHRPDLLPPMFVLLFGLLFDLLINGPIGSSSVVFMAVYAITLSGRVYWMTLQGSGLIGGFVLVAVAAELLSWGTASFSFGRLVSPTPALIEAIASIAVLPIARRAFVPLERMVGPAVP